MKPRVRIIQYTTAVQLTRLRGGVNAMGSGRNTDQYFICKGGMCERVGEVSCPVQFVSFCGHLVKRGTPGLII